MFITPADGSPLAFAGVWEAWDRQGRSDTALLSCAILTTQAGPSIRTIHERMPVVLKPSAYPGWLSEERVPDLDIVLTDWTLQEFNAWPVSSAVNSTRNNSPRLIERL
jgi:putative SOS response-associated peptidase YedK